MKEYCSDRAKDSWTNINPNVWKCCHSVSMLSFSVPFLWTWMLVLLTVVFSLSSGKCVAMPTHSQHTQSLWLAHIDTALSPGQPSGGSSEAVVCFWPLLCQSVANCLLSLQASGYLYTMSTPSVPLVLVVSLSVFWSFHSSSLFFFSYSFFFYCAYLCFLVQLCPSSIPLIFSSCLCFRPLFKTPPERDAYIASTQMHCSQWNVWRARRSLGVRRWVF